MPRVKFILLTLSDKVITFVYKNTDIQVKVWYRFVKMNNINNI